MIDIWENTIFWGLVGAFFLVKQPKWKFASLVNATVVLSQRLQDPPPLNMWLEKPWNLSGSCLNMKDWLVSDYDAEARNRLQVMGNIVVPAQAALAAAVLAKVLRL